MKGEVKMKGERKWLKILEWKMINGGEMSEGRNDGWKNKGNRGRSEEEGRTKVRMN